MRKTVLFAAAGVGLMIALASHDAQAFAPMGAMPVAPSDVTTVAGGCGFGWHRGPWGGCRRNYSSAWRVPSRNAIDRPPHRFGIRSAGFGTHRAARSIFFESEQFW